MVPFRVVFIGCRFPVFYYSRDCVFDTGCLELCACLAGWVCNSAGAWVVTVKVFCEATPNDNLLEKRSLRAGPSFLNRECIIGDCVARFAAMLPLCSMESIALSLRLAELAGTRNKILI